MKLGKINPNGWKYYVRVAKPSHLMGVVMSSTSAFQLRTDLKSKIDETYTNNT